MCIHVCISHRTVLSCEPDAALLPSGLMATLLTYSLCPLSSAFCRPVTRSHSLCTHV